MPERFGLKSGKVKFRPMYVVVCCMILHTITAFVCGCYLVFCFVITGCIRKKGCGSVSQWRQLRTMRACERGCEGAAAGGHIPRLVIRGVLKYREGSVVYRLVKVIPFIGCAAATCLLTEWLGILSGKFLAERLARPYQAYPNCKTC